MREKGFGFWREAICSTYWKKKEERKEKKRKEILVLMPFAWDVKILSREPKLLYLSFAQSIIIYKKLKMFDFWFVS